MKFLPVLPSRPTKALLARVSAGEPLSISDEFEQIDLNHMLTRGSPYCILIQIRGDSMSDEIEDGDWVMLDRARAPQPGNIVLANLDGEFTLKRHKLNDCHKRGLYLVPANNLYKTRKITEGDQCEIVGVVTHVIHKTV